MRIHTCRMMVGTKRPRGTYHSCNDLMHTTWYAWTTKQIHVYVVLWGSARPLSSRGLMRRATTTTTTTNISFNSREIKLRDASARVSRGLPVGQRKRNAWPQPSRKCRSSSSVAYERIFLKFVIVFQLLLLRRMKPSSNRPVFQYYRVIVGVRGIKKYQIYNASARAYQVYI